MMLSAVTDFRSQLADDSGVARLAETTPRPRLHDSFFGRKDRAKVLNVEQRRGHGVYFGRGSKASRGVAQQLRPGR
jgi:hypothetical protein